MQWSPQILYNNLFGRNVNFGQETTGSLLENHPIIDFDSEKTTNNSSDLFGHGWLDKQLFANLWEVLKNNSNEVLLAKTSSLTRSLLKEIANNYVAGLFVPFDGYLLEDDNFVIEWIYENFRIAITITSGEEIGTWCLVSKPKAGGATAYGSLSKENSLKIISWLVSFVLQQK